MTAKTVEKEKAIGLRKQGFSYSEILKDINVAKSTLSLWLRDVGLAKRHKERLSRRKLDAALRGAQRRREQRRDAIAEINKKALQDIHKVSRRELWLSGVMLYWAEGSKEKEGRPGSGIRFTNSDPWMIKIFLKWLSDIAHIDREQIYFEIYIHENSKNSIPKVRRYWAQVTRYPLARFSSVYFKKDKVKTMRKNTGDSYYGLLRVKVRMSSILQRKIMGWVHGICRYYWGQEYI